MIEKRSRDTDYDAKAVTLGGARYIVCSNRQEAAKDATERSAILVALQQLMNVRYREVGTSARMSWMGANPTD